MKFGSSMYEYFSCLQSLLLSIILISIVSIDISAQGVKADNEIAMRTVSFETSEGTALSFDISPDGETIVFDLLGQLWTLPIDGGKALPLTHAVRDTADDIFPQISPDGKRIAFYSDRPGGWGIFVVGANGGEVARLVSGLHRWDVPPNASWSPDGRYLAYVENNQVKLLDISTEESHPIEMDNVPGRISSRPLSWTPDGDKIVFSAADELLEVSTRGGTVDSLFIRGNTPRYSPDGEHLAYLARDENDRTQIWVRRFDSEESKQLTEHRDLIGHQRWTSDGSELIYSADGRLWRMSLVGDEPIEIPFTAHVEFERQPIVPAPVRFPEPGLEIAARGHMGLAICNHGEKIGMIALGKLWVFTSDDKPVYVSPIPETAEGLSWSPDCREVVWSAGRGGAQDIYTTNIGKGRTRQLTRLPGQAIKPTWSPDGNHIAFAYWAQPTLDTPAWEWDGWNVQLLVMRLDAEPLEQTEDALDLAALPLGWNHWAFSAAQEIAYWSPDGSWIIIPELQNPYLVNLAGERLDFEGLTGPVTFLNWLTDDSIVFVRNGHLWQAKLNFEEKKISEEKAISDEPALYLSVSRNGNLLYLSEDGLRLRQVDGSTMHIGWPLTFTIPDAPPSLLIRGAMVIKGDGSLPLSPQDILIEDGRISQIENAGTIHSPEVADIIDATGKFIMPGLIDMHIHLWDDAVLPGLLYTGVTTAREVGGPIARVAGIRDDIETGTRKGPRILFGGFQLYSGEGFSGVTGHAPMGGDGKLRTIKIMRALGATNLKMRQFSDWHGGTKFLSLARNEGWPSSGHVALPLPLVAAGISGMEHLGPSGIRTDQLLYDDVVSLFREAGIWLVPTVVGYSQVPRVIDKPEILDEPDTAPFVTPFLRIWVTRLPPARHEAYSRFAEVTRLGTKKLYDGGVTILAGSDTPGFPWGLHVELEELVASGLSPREALVAATSDAAAILGAEEEIGTIEEGKRADLIILDADPLEDIRNTREIWKIIKDGRVVDREGILEWVKQQNNYQRTNRSEE